MPSLTVLYTKPAENAEAFVEEYKADHVPIAERFPKMSGHSTTVFTGTPRRTDPAFLVMFQAHWDSAEDRQAAMGDDSMMEASKHAMGMTQKYGNSAEMMLGE